jgi:hypothetical protein
LALIRKPSVLKGALTLFIMPECARKGGYFAGHFVRSDGKVFSLVPFGKIRGEFVGLQHTFRHCETGGTSNSIGITATFPCTMM